MTDFEKAYQRLEVLRGVCLGLVSTCDVAAIAGLMGIPDERMGQLIAYLKSRGMAILPDEEKIALLAPKASPAEANPLRYRHCDQQLDKLLQADAERALIGPWLERLYRRRNSISSVVFLKLGGLSAEAIAAALDLSLEQVYLMEHQAIVLYRSIFDALTRPRISHRRTKRIEDFYE